MAISREQPRASVATVHPRRRSLSLSQVVVLLLMLLFSAVVGYLGYQRLAPTTSPVAAPATTPVRRGTIAATISVSGSTAAVSQAKLAFESAGRLVDVPVKAGDSVSKGAVLAKLDDADLAIQVAQAEVSLEQSKLKLTQLKEGPKEVEVAAARASYDSAVTKYEELKAGSKPEDITAARSAVRDADVALANARNNLVLVQKSATVSRNVRDRENEHNWVETRYGEALARFNQGQSSQEEVDREWSNLLAAKEKLDSARMEADLSLRKAENDVVKAEESVSKSQSSLEKLLAGATPEQLKSAEASMLTAQSQLETKTAGSSATDVAAQEVAVRFAEATLKQRQILLEKAMLLAPFDGIIDAINVNVGEQVSAAKEVMSIVNMMKFRIDARVDEIDVVRLAVGQTVAVTMDALPNESLRARVGFVGSNAIVQQGVVSYPVVLDLDPTRAPVRPGMSANAAVEVTRQDNVLLVPNRAVKTQGRNRTVEVLVDGKPEVRTVSLGMSNDQFTEVKDGLQEGDLAIIPTTTTTAPRVPQSGGFAVPGGLGGGPGGFGR